ncbi:MAG: DNA repair protein RecN [Oscillospiraceae bacterium]
MLRELFIENLAVIRRERILFTGGFNALTGETGAGKSILINGINAILGQRVTRDMVRTGEAKATVTAVFDEIPREASEKLAAFGLASDDEILTMTREIGADGRSTARVNYRTVNTAVLRELGDLLVNVHGQHDSQQLLNPDCHLAVLDAFAECGEALADYRAQFKLLQETARAINKLKAEESQRAQRIEKRTEIVREIGALKLEENEDEQVEEEFSVLLNSAELKEAAAAAHGYLAGEEGGARELVFTAAERLTKMGDILPEMETLAERLRSAAIELDDIAAELSVLMSRTEFDGRRFDQLSARRDELIKIKRKYGPSLADVLAVFETSTAELEALSGGAAGLDALLQKRQALLADCTKRAKELSEIRKNAAQRFCAQVAAELEFLNMPSVKIEVRMEQGKLTADGLDSAELLISANPGEVPKPIAKIASGGELSRIMLALKNVTAQRDGIDTLIFDEIDAGVSGHAAQKIGLKIGQIAKIRQVLCVTHLSQIAVVADNHILIEKAVADGRTETSVRTLDFEGRKRELARIMGGAPDPSALMLQNAEELLRASHPAVR